MQGKVPGEKGGTRMLTKGESSKVVEIRSKLKISTIDEIPVYSLHLL
jgi:hypothetical protein